MSTPVQTIPEVWVKLDGVVVQPNDIMCDWLIGDRLPGAKDALEYAATLGNVFIYGEACVGIRGQRKVQRMFLAEGLPYYWISERSEPPASADEVIDTWPIETKSTSSPSAAVQPPNAESNSAPAT